MIVGVIGVSQTANDGRALGECSTSLRLPTRRYVQCSLGVPDVGSLALSADEAEEFGRPGAGATEPVRGAGVELDGFARRQNEVLLSEHEAEAPVQDEGPVESFVNSQVGAQKA
jgi:hypothetical protein